MRPWDLIDFEAFKADFIEMLHIIEKDFPHEEKDLFFINPKYLLNSSIWEIRCSGDVETDFLLLRFEFSSQRISCSNLEGTMTEVTSRAMFREQLLGVINSDNFKNKLTRYFIFIEHSL